MKLIAVLREPVARMVDSFNTAVGNFDSIFRIKSVIIVCIYFFLVGFCGDAAASPFSAPLLKRGFTSRYFTATLR